MAEELQQLWDRICELEAERDRLSQAGDPTQAGPIDRIIYLPQERKCPMFRGTHGIGIED